MAPTIEDIGQTVFWFPTSIESSPYDVEPRSGKLTGFANNTTTGGIYTSVVVNGYSLDARDVHRTADEAKHTRGQVLAKKVNSLREHAVKLLTVGLPDFLIINDDLGNLKLAVDPAAVSLTKAA